MMVKQSTVSIDTTAFRAWADTRTETYTEIGEAIGKGASYISDCIRRGVMPKKVYNLFLRVFDLPDGSFQRLEETPPQKSPWVMPSTCWLSRIACA